MTAAKTDRDWDAKYRTGDTPWDSRETSRELTRVLEEYEINPGRALELGCGTGTNAIFLATRGFSVTAIDCAIPAIETARERAQSAGVEIDWHLADVQHFGADLAPFDFVFDRGVYHCCRRVDLDGYLATLAQVTRPGTLYLSLAGNVNEGVTTGPPRVSATDICRELEPLFEIVHLREFHFMDAGGVQGPLGWSTLLRRKETR